LENVYYGISRLFHAYLPWIEKWHNGGYRDSRRVFFYKYAFNGGTMRHPQGSTPTLVDPVSGYAMQTANSEIARREMDYLRNGGTLTLPSTKDAMGNYLWEYQPASVTPSPEGLMEYGRDLDQELWEGMGIPPEVAETPGDSMGSFGGRSVPMDAFNCILHSIYTDAMESFVKQIVHPLVVLQHGRDKSYFNVKASGLLRDNEDVLDEEGNPVDGDEKVGTPEKPNTKKKKPGTAMSHTGQVLNVYVSRAKSRRDSLVHAGGDYRYGE
jgi:hypothetical protein